MCMKSQATCINFLIGFQPKNNNSEANTCKCECDSRLYPYITGNKCNYQTGMLERNFWITYMYNDDSPAPGGYVIYPHCPLDYCVSNVPVNLDNGSDDFQCAKNRSGTLCGACKLSLNMSFGSFRCLQCSTVCMVRDISRHYKTSWTFQLIIVNYKRCVYTHALISTQV